MLFSGCSTARRYAPILLPTLLVSLGQISVLSRLALFFPHFRVEGRNYAETQRASAPPRDGTASKTAKRTRTGGTSAAGLSISKWDALWPLLQPPLNFAFPESLDFPSDLRPYQIDGVRFLADNDNALLADDMGTGKTVQTTAALRILAQKGKVRSALVVCPLAVLSSWERHILEWGRVLTCVAVRGNKNERKLQWEGSRPEVQSIREFLEGILRFDPCSRNLSFHAFAECVEGPSRFAGQNVQSIINSRSRFVFHLCYRGNYAPRARFQVRGEAIRKGLLQGIESKIHATDPGCDCTVDLVGCAVIVR